MERQWTPAQSAAMNIRNKTLLVSAAAGSGKTATLTERIIRSLTDREAPADISKMLIVTFTRAAAEELKNRIFSALSKALAKDPANRHLTNQLVKLGSARICTIDSFYLELVRSNFSQLGIPASLRIGDGAELEVLRKTVMEEVVDSFYDTREEFPAFAECFTGTRSADRLCTILLDLYMSVSSVPEGVEFLRINAEGMKRDADAQTDFFSTAYGQILCSRTADTVRYCLSVFESACAYLSECEAHATALLPSFDYDRTFCLLLLDALKNREEGYHRTKDLLESFQPIALKRLKSEFITEESESYKALRTRLHAKLRELAKKSFSKEPKTILRAMKDTTRYTSLLYELLKQFEARFSEEKLRRGIMEFNDVRRLTLRLLVDEHGEATPTAKQYAKEFTDIYIDEYQDVDQVQDMIFRAISTKTNRFMVGDIKQSIYGFRGAEPQVFSNYRATFPEHQDPSATDSNELTVFMSENFRCDESVIRFTNLICSRLFSACADSIGYRAADDLVFSKRKPSEDYQSPAVKIAVLLTTPDVGEDETGEEEQEPLEKFEAEAAYIASEIHRLISQETKADGTPILPGDIAVLFRSRKISPFVAQALREYGILSSESDGDRYFENPDVLMVLCLLNAIDNPHRDIFLAGALRSPIFGFSMDDLIRIRRSSDDTYSLYDALLSYKEGEDELARKCRDFDHTLSSFRKNAKTLPVDRFLRTLFESDSFIASGLVSDRTESGDGGNLLRLYEYARTFEAGSFKGLYNFIEFINTIIEDDKKMKVPPKGTSPDRVNLMTIHQSKGLEFPVCFICGTGAWFNREDQRSSLLFEYPTGVAMKISDSTGFARINTPMREALAANSGIRQSEEEMRVLYVALTRARERLYVTATSKVSKEKIMKQAASRAKFSSRYSLLNCNCYLDWILTSLADPTVHADYCKLSFYSAQQITEPNSPIDSEEEKEPSCQPAILDQALCAELKEKFSFRYPYTDFRRIPAKMSVSRLSPDILDETDDSIDLFEQEHRTRIPDFFISGKQSASGAAERGTATHLFLQFCDFANAKKNGINEEISRLVEKRFIPQGIADLLYTEELETFLHSELMTYIENASQIIREQRFNLFLSPDQFTTQPYLKDMLRGENMAVQGVMDLVLIDGEGRITLFDYKTDRLREEERQNPALAARQMNRTHGLQLSYYAQAVSLLFDRPCDRVCVYSTHAGRLFDIDVLPLTIPPSVIDNL